ncbi:MAG: exo-alpha-sialidase [Geodermatophilaceae bacterium]|nr:exo-alpha-sialidase [Geodermatophilaceae bacterium]
MSAPVRTADRNAIVLAVLVVVVALIGGLVFLATRGADRSAPSTAGAAGIAHVHGLGVDPQDGVLYAGTHYGLFSVPETEVATVVADRVQDFMGFTVVGPGHYLASGHPGEGQGGPSSLGLIESTDGGQTWQSLSLAGEADFHSLEARHGLVYGLNSATGEFMVSQDKQSWDSRSQIPMADFAVSPYDPNVLLATTEQGLVGSEDGGRDFQPVPSAPIMQLVTWAGDGTVFGVAPDGTVHASSDDGQSWQQRGSLDAAPEALTVTESGDVFAAAAGAILVSVDGGRTFTVRYSE